MATYEFDSLLESLGSVVEKAQKSIDLKNQVRLQRLFEEGKDGKTRAVTWMCSVPSDKHGKRYEQISFPLLSLRTSHFLRISEVSFEFDSKVETIKTDHDVQSKTEKKVSRSDRLVLWLRNWKNVPRKGLERIKITFKGGEPLEGEVRVNGQILKKFRCNDK